MCRGGGGACVRARALKDDGAGLPEGDFGAAGSLAWGVLCGGFLLCWWWWWCRRCGRLGGRGDGDGGLMMAGMVGQVDDDGGGAVTGVDRSG